MHFNLHCELRRVSAQEPHDGAALHRTGAGHAAVNIETWRWNLTTMADVVTIRVAGTDVTVRSAILMNCSPVLEGILRDGDPHQPPVISMDDVDIDAVNSFVKLASMLSHEAEGVIPIGQIAAMTPGMMPLVHKYDAKGMLNLLKSAVDAVPVAEHVMAIVKHSSDADGIEWMTEKTRAIMINDLCRRSCNKETREFIEPEQKMAELPHTTVAHLFAWAMTTTEYKMKYDGAANTRSLYGYHRLL